MVEGLTILQWLYVCYSVSEAIRTIQNESQSVTRPGTECQNRLKVVLTENLQAKHNLI